MIRPLRHRHRRIVTALGVILPVAFAVGIMARKPVPTATALPAALAAVPQHFESVEWIRPDLFPNTPIQVRLTREQMSAGRFAVEFAVTKDFLKPDLIVYWVTGNPTLTFTLPDNAMLLGVFNPAVPLLLSPDAALGDGVLVLYSLADQEIVEVSKPFTAKQN